MKFLVFKKGKLVQDIDLSSAYLFGADTIPLRASNKIKFKAGIIECNKKTPESAGLAMLWPVDGLGKVLLPTTRLNERQEPYVLNVEMARAKLMQVTLKLEDWLIFEQVNHLAELITKGKSLFIKSLKYISNPQKASVLADESLKNIMEFAEQLAVAQGDKGFSMRCKNKTLGRHSLGCQIDPKRLSSDKYRKWLFEMFGYVTIPVNWGKIEREKGDFDFSELDRCIEKLGNQRLAICAGPLVCFSEDHLPQWLRAEKNRFGTVRDAAYEFVFRIITRYAEYIHAWRVISGMNALNPLGFSFEQIIDMTRTACLAAKSADDKSRKILEVIYPWTEYYAHNRDTVPTLVYIDTVMQSGIGFDAFGLQLKFGADIDGMRTRDMLQVSSRLDCLALTGKPVHLTEVSVPSHAEKGDGIDPDASGVWKNKWDQSSQADWIDQFYRIALGKGFISSITYSDLMDGNRKLSAYRGLINGKTNPKKALLSIARLQKLILNR